MDQDINYRIDYLKEKAINLVDLCDKEITENVSNEVRNITQDILTDLNRALDIIMFYFYTFKIKPFISEEQNKKYEKSVFFPVCGEIEELKRTLSKFGCSDLEKNHYMIFNLIENIQPYRSNEWIRQLRDYSNLGHRKIIGQRKHCETYISIEDTVKISDKANVTFRNCFMNGKAVRDLTVDKGVISGKFDSRLNPKVKTNIFYLLENSDINVVWLCQKSLQEIEKLFKEFNNYIKS